MLATWNCFDSLKHLIGLVCDVARVAGRVFYNMQVSYLKLGTSRAFWLVAASSLGHEILFDAHTRYFTILVV
jgi:hypothetical protein